MGTKINAAIAKQFGWIEQPDRRCLHCGELVSYWKAQGEYAACAECLLALFGSAWLNRQFPEKEVKCE